MAGEWLQGDKTITPSSLQTISFRASDLKCFSRFPPLYRFRGHLYKYQGQSKIQKEKRTDYQFLEENLDRENETRIFKETTDTQ